MKKSQCLFMFFAVVVGVHSQTLARFALSEDDITINRLDDGYRGIWYYNQKSGDEYVYKYSGGLGTYCAKHQPFAVYCKAVDRTFFCYGGTTKDCNRKLIHCVSYFDHRTGTVPRPTILLDKKTEDAHDNPVISVDDEGYIWIFSTSHGRSRPSFIHRSREPYNVASFQRIKATYRRGNENVPLTNFSYMQAWHVTGKGFFCFFTRYGDPAKRTNMFMTSKDGMHWSPWRRLAAIEWGQYQISVAGPNKVAAAFNFHPEGKGLNWRTNLYYIESSDFGRTWQSIKGSRLTVPLVDANNDALVHDYRGDGLNVYLKDMCFDNEGRPVILYVTSGGYESGPKNNPRTWTVARWTNDLWRISPITTSDNNYDMGSLYLESDGTWRVIGPTQPGPQPFNPGGEVAMWISRDDGKNWKMAKSLTAESTMNHTYVRRPVHAHSDFYAIWADGHGRQPSHSRIYFCNRDGDVFMLPPKMDGEFSKPIPVPSGQKSDN